MNIKNVLLGISLFSAIVVNIIASEQILSEPVPFEKDGKWGFMKDNKVEIPPKYDSAGTFSEGLAAVKIDGKWGYIDPDGDIIIKPNFIYADNFSNGLAVVSETNSKYSYGYINKKGTYAISPLFADAKRFSEGLAAVAELHVPKEAVELGIPAESKEWGYIDSKGKILIPYQFEEAYDFCDGMTLVIKNDNPKYIDKNGKDIVLPKLQEGQTVLDNVNVYGVNLMVNLSYKFRGGDVTYEQFFCRKDHPSLFYYKGNYKASDLEQNLSKWRIIILGSPDPVDHPVFAKQVNREGIIFLTSKPWQRTDDIFARKLIIDGKVVDSQKYVHYVNWPHGDRKDVIFDMTNLPGYKIIGSSEEASVKQEGGDADGIVRFRCYVTNGFGHGRATFTLIDKKNEFYYCDYYIEF